MGSNLFEKPKEKHCFPNTLLSCGQHYKNIKNGLDDDDQITYWDARVFLCCRVFAFLCCQYMFIIIGGWC